MAIETDDIELDTSTSTQESDASQPAVDAAPADDSSTVTATPGGGEADDTQEPNKASQGDQQSKTSESEKTRADRAIDFLAGKDKRAKEKAAKIEAEKAEDPADKAAIEKDKKPPAKPAKPDPKAPSDLTAEERAALPEKTRQRFDKLLSERKAATAELTKMRTEYEQAKPTLERGQAFSQVVEQFKLQDDLAVCEDEDVAGAVSFQASLRRLSSGKGTQEDQERCRMVFQQLDQDRVALGMAPAAPPAPPAPDVAAWEKALSKADEHLDFSDLRKLVADLKAPPKAEEKPAPTAPVVRQQQPVTQAQKPAPQAPVEDPDDRLFEAKAIKHIQAGGQQASPEYFQKTLFPRILNDLRKIYPKDNPVVVFQRLSPRARHDLTVEAFDALQKQTAKLPTEKPNPKQRPVAAGGTKPAWAGDRQPASSTAAAIQFLSGS